MEEEVSALEIKEEIEKSAEFNNGWSKYLALTTAVIAVLSAITSLQSGNYADRSILEKNNAVLLQSQASDQWNYYQSKGVKKSLAEGFAAGSTDTKYEKQISAYAQEQLAIQKKAQDLEQQAKDANEDSTLLFEKHHKAALGVTLFQIAVALSAMSALLRKKSLWYLSLTASIIGICLYLYGISK